MADVHQLFEEKLVRRLNLMESHFDQQDKKLDELMEKTRKTRRRSASLEQGARQSRLAMEEDVQSYGRRCSRTSGEWG